MCNVKFSNWIVYFCIFLGKTFPSFKFCCIKVPQWVSVSVWVQVWVHVSVWGVSQSGLKVGYTRLRLAAICRIVRIVVWSQNQRRLIKLHDRRVHKCKYITCTLYRAYNIFIYDILYILVYKFKYVTQSDTCSYYSCCCSCSWCPLTGSDISV